MTTYQTLQGLLGSLGRFGALYETLLIIGALGIGIAALVPVFERWRGWVLAGAALVLLAGELVLVWLHLQLYQSAAVISPDGLARGSVAVPLWIEGEKLFVWALVTAVLGLGMRRHRAELQRGVLLIVALLMLGAATLGRPFTDPLPSFLGQYLGYLQAMNAGGVAAENAYAGMESARQFYYNAWYMWVHPPLLFLAYGAFALSFVATLKMIATRRASFETTAYRWARFGYLWLTLGMLLGLPWALMSWQGEAWWWSGKVNMSLMMWLLYTAYLHARLYLRRQGQWKLVAGLAVLSFVVLVMTYATTYIVPGAHSYADASAIRTVAVARPLDLPPALGRGGGS